MIAKIDEGKYVIWYIDTEKRRVFSIDKKTGEKYWCKNDEHEHTCANPPHWGHISIEHLICFAEGREYIPKISKEVGCKPNIYIVNEHGKISEYKGTRKCVKALHISWKTLDNTLKGKHTTLTERGVEIKVKKD